MEKKIQIKTSDNYIINGVLNLKNKSKKLIIFVHGLTGHKNEHHFFNSAKYFTEKGFETFRFDLYSGGENCRRLRNCTIKTHSRDLEMVLNYFDGNYEEIFLVGHSLGGPTILWSNHKVVKSIVLWDPSFAIMDSLSEDLNFNEKLNLYLIDFGTEFLLSKEMIEEWKVLPNNLLDNFIKPTKIICAGKEILHVMWRKNLSKIKINCEFFTIKEASHVFDEEGTEEKLFEETLKWFEK